jgi:hypothetical protein
MPKELGINTSVVMTPSARAFVRPVVIGQSGQWIGGWINPAGQLMGQAADNAFMLSTGFHDHPASPGAQGHQSK